MFRQTWRGIGATPRAMGWGPTARSFVQRIFGTMEDGRRKKEVGDRE